MERKGCVVVCVVVCVSWCGCGCVVCGVWCVGVWKIKESIYGGGRGSSKKKSFFVGVGVGVEGVGVEGVVCVGVSCPNRDNGLDLWKERR